MFVCATVAFSSKTQEFNAKVFGSAGIKPMDCTD